MRSNRSCKLWSVAMVATVILSLTACDDSTAPGTSRLSLLLTDAPGDVAEAWVEITGIYLQGTPAEPGEKMWLLEETTGLLDLITLDDQTFSLVEDAVVGPGVFSQLRLIVGEAAIVVSENDTDVSVYATPGLDLATLNAAREAFDPTLDPLASIDGELHCPSCNQTGFKVNLPGGAVQLDGEAQVLVIDFDAQQTFGRLAGTSGHWVMEPTLSASDFSWSGTIAGTVSWAGADPQLACGGGTVSLADFRPTASLDAVTKTGVPDADGSYAISFVEPGTWTLGFEAVTFDNGDVLSFEADHPATVSVASGSTATANFQITTATCN